MESVIYLCKKYNNGLCVLIRRNFQTHVTEVISLTGRRYFSTLFYLHPPAPTHVLSAVQTAAHRVNIAACVSLLILFTADCPPQVRNQGFCCESCLMNVHARCQLRANFLQACPGRGRQVTTPCYSRSARTYCGVFLSWHIWALYL